jgi:RHS repeat-associated protein
MTGLNLDEMLARVTTLNATNTTQARTYLTDALGSVMAQTQDNQSTLAGYSYSPYGQTQSTGNTEGDSVQYTGRENDNNGLYYYRARYYDPVLKRFLSEDPIGLAGGSLSFYSYVDGDPISYIDPEGTIPIVPILIKLYLFWQCYGDCMSGFNISDVPGCDPPFIDEAAQAYCIAKCVLFSKPKIKKPRGPAPKKPKKPGKTYGKRK